MKPTCFVAVTLCITGYTAVPAPRKTTKILVLITEYVSVHEYIISAMENVIEEIRKALEAETLTSVRMDTQRWFKEEIKTYGLKSASIGKISKMYFAEVKHLTKDEVFALCEPLWQSGYLEESGIACDWVSRFHKDFEPKDWAIFERWIDAYITNWAR